MTFGRFILKELNSDTLLFSQWQKHISIFILTVIGHMKQTKMKWPLYAGFISTIISCLLLITITNTSIWGYIILSVSLIFEALGMAILHTLRESLVAIHVHPEERSGIMALLQTTVMLVVYPLGY